MRDLFTPFYYDPTYSEVERGGDYMDMAQSIFELLGYDMAVDNLKRYRSGVGGTRSYTAEEMEKHPAYGDAIDTNRSRFESLTFTGRTGKPELNEALRNLQDGQTITFKDNWDDALKLTSPSTYCAFGRSNVNSDGTFTATRNGDKLTIRGDVTNRLGTGESKNLEAPPPKKTESFDFNPWQIGYREGHALEEAGKAKPFEMDYQRRQSVDVEGRYDRDNNITVLDAIWGLLE